MSLTHNKNGLLNTLADKAYLKIASLYPVCSFSDEFYFFPQIVLVDKDWSVWDDFSEDSITLAVDSLAGFEQELSAIALEDLSPSELVDKKVLQRCLKTLREQLAVVAPHRSQPTFHLTILAAGLAEALESGEIMAWNLRVATVADFLRRAAQCLSDVPHIFLRLGVEMCNDLQVWMKQLQVEGRNVADAVQALREYQVVLQRLEPAVDYRLPGEHLEILLQQHLCCDLYIDQLTEVLEEELEEMKDALDAEAGRLVPGKGWLDVERHIPFVEAGENGLPGLYREELGRMENHCRQYGMLPEGLAGQELKVMSIPGYMSTIRASDAYAATPGFPPRGGVFFVMDAGRERDGKPGRTVEYRMTAVHEAWPGHHLLDSSRWALKNPLRRTIELPLFYEGWACLAEEIMARTGYLDGPWDRFLLARRRAERAARGLIDVGLQSGSMTMLQACDLLVGVGYQRAHAEVVVSKYLLRPGYQVCYTLGLKQGLDLLERYGKSDVGRFARTLLGQGEIGFSALAEVFADEEKRSQA